MFGQLKRMQFRDLLCAFYFFIGVYLTFEYNREKRFNIVL